MCLPRLAPMTTTNHELCSLHRWRAGFPALWSQPGLTESHTCQSWQQWSQGMRLQDTRHHSLTELLCSRLTLVALGGGSPSAREDRKAPSCLWLIPQHKNRWSFIYGNHGLWYPNIWTGNWQRCNMTLIEPMHPNKPKIIYVYLAVVKLFRQSSRIEFFIFELNL